MKVIVNSGLFGFNNLVAEWKWLFSQMSVKAVGNKSWHNSDSVSYKRKLNSSSGVHTVSLQLRCGLPKKRTMYVEILQICVDVNKQDDVSQILWKIFRCVPLNPSVLVTNKWVLGNVGCVEIQGDSLGLILAVCFNTTWNYGSSLFCKGEVPKQIAATLRRRTSWNLTSACLPVVTDILVCVPDQFDIFSGTTTRSNFTEVVVPTFLIVLSVMKKGSLGSKEKLKSVKMLDLVLVVGHRRTELTEDYGGNEFIFMATTGQLKDSLRHIADSLIRDQIIEAKGVRDYRGVEIREMVVMNEILVARIQHYQQLNFPQLKTSSLVKAEKLHCNSILKVVILGCAEVITRTVVTEFCRALRDEASRGVLSGEFACEYKFKNLKKVLILMKVSIPYNDLMENLIGLLYNFYKEEYVKLVLESSAFNLKQSSRSTRVGCSSVFVCGGHENVG